MLLAHLSVHSLQLAQLMEKASYQVEVSLACRLLTLRSQNQSQDRRNSRVGVYAGKYSRPQLYVAGSARMRYPKSGGNPRG